jgi:transposase
MKNCNYWKLEAIAPGTLIVGVDIAKGLQWARFIDYRSLELRKPLKFQNDKIGFKNILASIQTICKDKKLDNVIVGLNRQVITGNHLQTT